MFFKHLSSSTWDSDCFKLGVVPFRTLMACRNQSREVLATLTWPASNSGPQTLKQAKLSLERLPGEDLLSHFACQRHGLPIRSRSVFSCAALLVVGSRTIESVSQRHSVLVRGCQQNCVSICLEQLMFGWFRNPDLGYSQGNHIKSFIFKYIYIFSFEMMKKTQ